MKRTRHSAGAPCYANGDGSTRDLVVMANDIQCFLNKFAAGCTCRKVRADAAAAVRDPAGDQR